MKLEPRPKPPRILLDGDQTRNRSLYLRFRSVAGDFQRRQDPKEDRLTSKTMPHPIVAALALAVCVALAGAPLAADQQESYSFTLGLLGGAGGSLDAEPDPGLGQSSYMLMAGMITEPRTMVAVRAGRLKIDGDEGFEQYATAELEYVNIAGEYRFRQSYYDYGVYLGIGYYSLSGDLPFGGTDSESDLGVALGFTGDFDITRYLSVVGEISVHYAFLDSAAIYGMANIGLAVHF